MASNEIWIVDGFNVIRRNPEFAEAERTRGTDVAKRMLEERLGRLRARRGRGTSVVLAYDGAPPRSGPRNPKGLHVVYPNPGKSADDVVLAEARRSEGRGSVHVVTSDHQDIGRRLRGLRVRLHSVEEFTRLLVQGDRRSPGESAGAAEKPGELSGDDVDHWLQAFGDDN